MALHDVTDAQVEALLLLLQGALNAEFAAITTEDVVVATYPWPAVTNERVPQLGHPALAVWREDAVYVERTLQRTEWEVTWRIDYVLPATALELMGARWKLLGKVWEKAVETLEAGKHASVSSGARVLVEAGFTEIVIGQRLPRVEFVELAPEKGLYPSFRGRVRMRHREEPDTSGLPVVSLHTQPYPVGLPADERETFAGQIHDVLPLSGLVGWYELRGATVVDGAVTGLADLSAAGNDLAVIDAGGGGAMTLAADADYGVDVGITTDGGEVLFAAGFAGGVVLAQPYTVLWIGEWTGGDDGAAYDGASEPATLYRESGEGFLATDGAAVSVGTIPDDTPHPTLTIFDGADTKHYSGDDWSHARTVDAGTGPLEGILLALGNGAARPRAGKDAALAIWSRALSANEVAQAAAYLRGFGQTITVT